MQVSGVWRSVLWFGLGLVVAGVVISLWLFPRDTDTTTIRTYDVNPQIAAELGNALNSALWVGQNQRPLGQVTISPSGQLIVAGTESVQAGVRRVIEEVSARKLAPTPSLLFEAWLVTASAAGAGEGGSAAPGADARLAEIEPALAAIRKARGPVRFELVEKLATQARSGSQNSEVSGSRAAMTVTPTIRLGAKDEPVISARFKIETRGQNRIDPANPREIKSIAELRPGQLLVVGQSSLSGGPGTPPDSDLYYIVRASL
jgi:hypothetical protein